MSVRLPPVADSQWDVVRKYADLNELFRPLLVALPHDKEHEGMSLSGSRFAYKEGTHIRKVPT